MADGLPPVVLFVEEVGTDVVVLLAGGKERIVDGELDGNRRFEREPVRSEAEAARARGHVLHALVHFRELRGRQRPDGDPDRLVDGAGGDLDRGAAEGERLWRPGRDNRAIWRSWIFDELPFSVDLR